MPFGDLAPAQSDALLDRIGGCNGVHKLLSGEWIVGAPAAIAPDASGEVLGGLLQAIGAPVTVAASKRFAARDHFRVGRDGVLSISYIGDDFSSYFLPLEEHDVPAAALSQRRLVNSTVDAPIFATLGGQDCARIALAHVFAFLQSANRERWYFFYVRDVAGTLWAIDTYWRDGGWDMEAYSVTYPRGWRGGGHVVSR